MEPNHPVLSALIKLPAELGGHIKDNAREAIQLRADMKHVEAVMHILEPSFNARQISAKRKRHANPWYKRGTIFRAVLETLRVAPAPMSADEIGAALLRAKGIEPSRAQRRHMWGAVSSLRNHEGKTVVADDGRPRRWRILRATLQKCGLPFACAVSRSGRKRDGSSVSYLSRVISLA